VRKIGVIGDTQGRYNVATLLERVARHFSTVDEIWHAGDWQDEKVLDGLRALKPLTVVNGNAPDDPRFPMQVVKEVEGLRLGMVHRPPKPGDQWAAKLDICIHGHTHHWRDEIVDGVRFINVSTPTAAGFSRERTCGVLLLEDGTAQLERIEVER
jgi:putative phosphoesterase